MMNNDDSTGRCSYELLIEMMATNLFDTGYVWAPHVPAFETPQIVIGSRGMASVYATKTIDERFYGEIKITNKETKDDRT